METVLKQIMEQMDCTLEDAKIILNTTLETSNLVQNAIRLSVKKEYNLQECGRMNILKTYDYKGRLIWKYADHYQVEGYGECRTLKKSKQVIQDDIWED